MSNSILFGVEVKHFRANHTLRLRNKLVSLNEPLIMAIVNTTPDSFHEKSRIESLIDLDIFARKCLEKKVGIVDLGAHSTRPGYETVSAAQQIERLGPYLERIHDQFPDLYISIDTSLPEVAEYALKNGADIINDVEGGRNYPQIHRVCAHFNAPYILVHSRGLSENLHETTHYDNVTTDVLFELSSQVQKTQAAGVKDIILDLGFGFSKSIEQNFELLNNLSMFHMLGFPILCGLSRKSMIYKKLKLSVDDSLNGTTILNTVALMKNASILRVHDLDKASEVIELLKIP
jgi:dihydropteroate synthase